PARRTVTARRSAAPSSRRTESTADRPVARLWRAAWVLPVEGPPLRDGAVAVAEDRIAAVGPAAALRARHPAAEAVDLGRAILLPGLVDAHCHLEWGLLDGALAPAGFSAWLGRLLPLRARMSPADHRAAARLGALRALRAGVTTLADSGPTGAGAAAMAEI